MQICMKNATKTLFQAREIPKLQDNISILRKKKTTVAEILILAVPRLLLPLSRPVIIMIIGSFFSTSFFFCKIPNHWPIYFNNFLTENKLM